MVPMQGILKSDSVATMYEYYIIQSDKGGANPILLQSSEEH